MITIVHILADGTVKNDISGTVVPKEKCKQLYKIITDSDKNSAPMKPGGIKRQ